jgi:hypothetical protein
MAEERQNNMNRKDRFKRFVMQSLLATLACCTTLVASAEQTFDTKAYQQQEKRWQSCPDGYYTGPRPGRHNYSNDKYLWVVTPEFARRFCMPEHLIDTELKGAEAIAFKRVPSEDGDDRCVIESGKTRCI